MLAKIARLHIVNANICHKKLFSEHKVGNMNYDFLMYVNRGRRYVC